VRRAAFAVVLALLLIGPAAAAQYGGGRPLLTHADTRQDLEDVDIAAAARAAAKAAEPNVAASAEGLTRDWTCTPSTTNVADVDPALPQIHVVYAYASDRPNRFATWADRLQGNVSVVQRFLSAQSGGTKALRFDMRTDCTDDAVDITTVPLPNTRSYYLDDFDRVRDDTWAYFSANGGLGGPRDLMILADNLTAATNYWVGLGQFWDDDRPGSNNFNNGPGLTSVLWATTNSPADQWSDTETWWPEGFLHEITHNLGGVQGSAEHATLYGHCWDEADVMCYDDGSSIAMQSHCSTGSGTIDESYDCGKDDYYAPAPPAGSYLATHWNVYNSSFMASCASVAPACGGAGGPTPTPPVNSIAPGITGTPTVGQVLVATKGTWVNAPTHFGYRWQRNTAFGWISIHGATTPVYTPTTADIGLSLRIVVTATNADGAVAAASVPSASVAGPSTPAPTPTPTPSPAPPRLTSGSAWLTVTAGSPRGKRLGRVAYSAPGAGVVKTRSLRISRPTGRYAVELCATPLAGRVPTCTVKRLRARAGRLTLPALTARLGAGQRVRASLTVRSLSRRAIAATRGAVSLDV
jgi:hypothetical protein